MIIAFDFDKTLSDVRLQRLAKKLIAERNEVWVVTMRRDDDFNNKFMKPTLDKLPLSKYRVIFCDNKPKFEMIQMINADIYIDNISDEFEYIKNHTNTIPLLW